MWLFYTSVSPSTASYSGDEAWWDQPALMREIRCSPASAPAPASRIARFELWQCGGAERINSMPSLSKRITCMRLLCRTGERRSTGTSAPSHQFRLLAIGVFVLLETHGIEEPLAAREILPGSSEFLPRFRLRRIVSGELKVIVGSAQARGEANALTAPQYGNGPGNTQENSSNFQKRATTSLTSHPQLTGTL